MRTLKHHGLNFQSTYQYFIDQLTCDLTLSRIIVDNINFHEGGFFTELPENAHLKALYNFARGGIIPSQDFGAVETSTKNGLKFTPQIVPTTDVELSHFFQKYIRHDSKNYIILDNLLRDALSPHLKIENVDIVLQDQEAYYLLGEKNSEKEIYTAIRKSGAIRHFFAVLTSGSVQISDKFISDNESQICQNVKYIVVGAYDDEAYIVWQKL